MCQTLPIQTLNMHNCNVSNRKQRDTFTLPEKMEIRNHWTLGLVLKRNNNVNERLLEREKENLWDQLPKNIGRGRERERGHVVENCEVVSLYTVEPR